MQHRPNKVHLWANCDLPISELICQIQLLDAECNDKKNQGRYPSFLVWVTWKMAREVIKWSIKNIRLFLPIHLHLPWREDYSHYWMLWSICGVICLKMSNNVSQTLVQIRISCWAPATWLSRSGVWPSNLYS